MSFLNDPILWILCLIAVFIIAGPWLYKIATSFFRGSDREDCLKKIDWLMQIRSEISDSDVKKSIDSVMLVLIEEHGHHE